MKEIRCQTFNMIPFKRIHMIVFSDKIQLAMFLLGMAPYRKSRAIRLHAHCIFFVFGD